MMRRTGRKDNTWANRHACLVTQTNINMQVSVSFCFVSVGHMLSIVCLEKIDYVLIHDEM